MTSLQLDAAHLIERTLCRYLSSLWKMFHTLLDSTLWILPLALVSLFILGLSRKSITQRFDKYKLSWTLRSKWTSQSFKLISTNKSGKLTTLQTLRNLGIHSEVARSFTDLIETEGAGAWPPNANHETWPSALHPYRAVYWECIPFLSTDKISLDDSINLKRMADFRTLMRQQLSKQVDLDQVLPLLAEFEAGNRDAIRRDVYNAFYCVVGMCRHAYRYSPPLFP
jgi:hypothetical protein